VVDRLRGELPELPGERLRRLLSVHQLNVKDAEAVNSDIRRVKLVEALSTRLDASVAARFVLNEMVRADLDVALRHPNELIKLVERRRDIPRAAWDRAVEAAGTSDFSADEFLGDGVVADTSALEPLVDRILADNPDQVAAYKGGKEGLLGFFVGQVMKETQGKADPKVVNELLREKLSA
jgi:aspartyl-tRNA(Asn)/glutamyl-tRNA(Gln) amidotransferase subunit B